MERSLKVFAPATISNVGPGFDLLGFAISNPGDVLVIRSNSLNSLRIINHTPFTIPEDPDKNVASVSASSLLNHYNIKQGFDFIFESKITPGSGIGSSAASCAAAVVGINSLLNDPLSPEELLPFALEGETLASGGMHADNVAPALLGGFILIRSYNPLDIVRIKYPEGLHCIVVHPDIEIKTCESRKLLPKEISLQNVIKQCGNISGLIAGLNTSDYGLIGRSLEDVIAEPVRAGTIPGYLELKSGLAQNGAIGGNISGSGPSVFAFSNSASDAERVASLMQDIFNAQKINYKIYF